MTASKNTKVKSTTPWCVQAILKEARIRARVTVAVLWCVKAVMVVTAFMVLPAGVMAALNPTSLVSMPGLSSSCNGSKEKSTLTKH